MPLNLPRRAWLLIAGLAALLGACASLQSPTPADERDAAIVPPPTWQGTPGSAEPTSLALWWDRFDDAELSRLVRLALAQSTDIRVAQARLRQARAQRNAASAQLLPTLGASASAEDAWRDGRPSPSRVGTSLDASWEPDLWGVARSGVDAADANLAAQRATLGGTAVSVAAEVAAAYIDLRGSQARLAIATENLDSQQQTLQIAIWREQAGLVTQLDVEQARTAVEQIRAQLPALQAAIEQSMNALAVLTAQVPGTLAAQLAIAAPVPTAPPDLALAIPAEALRQRPDVAAAEQQLLAAAARVEQADARRLPRLSISGSVGLSALNVGALGSGAGLASLLAGISVPLFDGGSLKAQVQQQEGARSRLSCHRAARAAGRGRRTGGLAQRAPAAGQPARGGSLGTQRDDVGGAPVCQRPGGLSEPAADAAHAAAHR